jgi:NAD(P)-dependent dehydrogenase (short-subunit alcohol dehydrogenase family)
MREGGRLMGRLEGKVALVSGSAQGIGRAVAELFAEERALSSTRATSRTSRVARESRPVKLDVTKPDDWKKAVDAIVAKHGRIDMLVNNAGIVRAYGQVADTELEDFNAVVSVNLTGAFLGMKAVLPPMRKASKGSIINFSSIWGNVGVGGAAAYSAGKGGVRNLTKNAAQLCGGKHPGEFGPSGAHPYAAGRSPVGRDECGHRSRHPHAQDGNAARSRQCLPVPGERRFILRHGQRTHRGRRISRAVTCLTVVEFLPCLARSRGSPNCSKWINVRTRAARDATQKARLTRGAGQNNCLRRSRTSAPATLLI